MLPEDAEPGRSGHGHMQIAPISLESAMVGPHLRRVGRAEASFSHKAHGPCCVGSKDVPCSIWLCFSKRLRVVLCSGGWWKQTGWSGDMESWSERL